MKENSLKRLHMLGFQLYDILEKAKLWRQLKNQWFSGVSRLLIGRAWRTFKAEKKLCMTLQ